MYRNQFRSDRFNDHATATRRPGRGCSSGTHPHWVVSGGRGSAAPAARPRSPPNRSGRTGSAQQYRPRSPASVVPQGNATNYALVGIAAATHREPVNQASLGSPESVKPSNVPDQSDVLNLESAEGARAADSSTSTIPTKGYSSMAFTLQFGTLSPGVINKQCTPCTISAPLDLDEKKHEKCQAHHGLSSDKPNTVSSSPAQEQQKQEATDDLVIGTQSGYDNVHATASSNACVVHEPELSETPVLNSVPLAGQVCTDLCKVLPRTRSPSSPTQQQWQKEDVRKDVINASQSDTINKYPATKPKIRVQIPASYTPNIAPSSFMLPVPGRPLPLAFQQKQPQVPVEFRGPGVQRQSIGSVSSSLPVKMAVPMGNAPHIQPFFVHGAQPRALQQQAFIRQGQNLGCAPPTSRHLPQFGNMSIAQELSQQQPRSCDEQKRTIKITHPETHEELMLDRRGHSYMDAPPSGQMPQHNMNQLLQPVPTFSPLHKVYYPFRPNMYNTGSNMYNTGYLPNTSTIPLTSRQMSSKIQPTRHSFDPTNSNQPITSMKPPMPNPWIDISSRPPTNLHAASEVSSFKGLQPSTLSAPGQGALKLATVFLAGKNELSSQISILETPTLLRYSGESALLSQQGVCKLGLEISPEPAKLVSERNLKLPAATSACLAICTFSVKAKPVDIRESPVPAVTSSSDAKGELSHIAPLQSEAFPDTEASTKTDNVILTVASSGSNNTDGTSLDSRNSKYDANSILGKPPLIYTQETLPPKFAASSTFTEGLKAKVNPISFPEKTSEAHDSVPLQIQDVMGEDHTVNAKVTCSKSKAEHVNVTMC